MSTETTRARTKPIATAEPARFCSRCAEPPVATENERRPAFDRVCASCGLGVYLVSPAGPPPVATYIVVSEDLKLAAVSEAAEKLLGEEQEMVGKPLGSVLTSPEGEAALRRAVRRAALGFREATSLPVRSGRTRFTARVLPCGPPRAALVALIRP